MDRRTQTPYTQKQKFQQQQMRQAKKNENQTQFFRAYEFAC